MRARRKWGHIGNFRFHQELLRAPLDSDALSADSRQIGWHPDLKSGVRQETSMNPHHQSWRFALTVALLAVVIGLCPAPSVNAKITGLEISSSQPYGTF